MKYCGNCANNCQSEDRCLENNPKYASYGENCNDHKYHIDTRE